MINHRTLGIAGADLGVRKASAERGVRGSNLKDDKPTGALNIKPFGAKEEASSTATAGASTATFCSSEEGAGPGGRGVSCDSYTTQNAYQAKFHWGKCRRSFNRGRETQRNAHHGHIRLNSC